MTATVSAPANVARARQLLHSAAEASKQLEENVRELVAMRAWDVLGYENFSEMWEKENGFACPRGVSTLGVLAMAAEGMNPAGNRKVTKGHTTAQVARAIGLPTHSPGGYESSTAVAGILQQAAHGVPPDKITATSSRHMKTVIEKHGTVPYEPRKRQRPRRIGRTYDEMVQESLHLPRREADQVGEIARQADVPKAEIYRQAVAEYLARYRASRPDVAS